MAIPSRFKEGERVSDYFDSEEEISIADILHVNARDYDDIPISSNDISVRSFNCLMRAHINTLGVLLDWSIPRLKRIRNLGKTSLVEILGYVDENAQSGHGKVQKDLSIISDLCASAIKNGFQSGRLSSTKLLELSNWLISSWPIHDNLIAKLMKAVGQVEEDELLLLQESERKSREIEAIVSSINPFILDKPLLGFYKAYTAAHESPNIEIETKDTVKDIGRLLSAENEKSRLLLLKRFADWLQIDWVQRYKQIYEMQVISRTGQIYSLLASGGTLQSVADVVGLTRERVRQISLKVIRNLIKSDAVDFLRWVRAYYDYPDIITLEDLAKLSLTKEESICLIYLFPKDIAANLFETDTALKNVHHDKQKKSILFFDETEAVSAIKSMPAIIEEGLYARYLTDLANGIGLRVDTILLFASEIYKHQGNLYVQAGSLTVPDYCQMIMEKYYQGGIHVTEESELKQFRELLSKDYGFTISQDNRYLQRAITDVSYLCGKGLYKPLSQLEISEETKQSILDMLDLLFETHKRTAVAYNEVFCRLEYASAIADSPIVNPDVLHSVIKYLAPKYYVKKDYVCVSDDASFDDDVLEYIKSHSPIAASRVAQRFYITDTLVMAIVARHKELSMKSTMIRYCSII